MPSSHGIIQGDNAIAMVDDKHQVMVHGEAFGEAYEGHEMYVRNRNFWTKQGLSGVQYMAKQSDCRGCDLRKNCLRNLTTVARQVVRFWRTDRDGKQRIRRR